MIAAGGRPFAHFGERQRRAREDTSVKVAQNQRARSRSRARRPCTSAIVISDGTRSEQRSARSAATPPHGSTRHRGRRVRGPCRTRRRVRGCADARRRLGCLAAQRGVIASNIGAVISLPAVRVVQRESQYPPRLARSERFPAESQYPHRLLRCDAVLAVYRYSPEY